MDKDGFSSPLQRHMARKEKSTKEGETINAENANCYDSLSDSEDVEMEETEMDIGSHASSDHSASTTARSNTPKVCPTPRDTSETNESTIVPLGTTGTTTNQGDAPGNAPSLPRKSAEILNAEIEALDKQLASFSDPILSPNLSEKIRFKLQLERNVIVYKGLSFLESLILIRSK